MKPHYQISYRRGSKKTKHVDISKYNTEKRKHERILSFKVDPPVNTDQFMIPIFMECILENLTKGLLTIKGITEFKQPRNY